MTTVAAIDIGTNSTKLLVRSATERTFRIVDTRLGQDVHRTRRLHPDAVARTLATLGEFSRVADEAGVERLVAVTTSATRDAQDRDAFLDAAAAVLGTRPVVLGGEDEGRLAFLGAAQDLPLDPGTPRLVLDIGGGSTEFCIGTDELAGVRSIDVGSVRLTESELRGDPPRPMELTNAIGIVADHVEDIIRDFPGVLDVDTIVGIGGTITSVAAVELGAFDLDRIHGMELTRAAAEDVFRTLATESLADRLHNPGLAASRAPVIVGGLCVLVAVMRKLGADQILVSQRSLVDGVCARLLADRHWTPPGVAS